jgi:hypothetical protein
MSLIGRARAKATNMLPRVMTRRRWFLLGILIGLGIELFSLLHLPQLFNNQPTNTYQPNGQNQHGPPKLQTSNGNTKWTKGWTNESNQTENLFLRDPSTFQNAGVPTNIHREYPMTCSKDFVGDEILFSNVTIAFLELAHGYEKKKRTHKMSHLKYTGPIENGVNLLNRVQSCQYHSLERFWALAEKHNIT